YTERRCAGRRREAYRLPTNPPANRAATIATSSVPQENPPPLATGAPSGFGPTVFRDTSDTEKYRRACGGGVAIKVIGSTALKSAPRADRPTAAESTSKNPPRSVPPSPGACGCPNPGIEI